MDEFYSYLLGGLFIIGALLIIFNVFLSGGFSGFGYFYQNSHSDDILPEGNLTEAKLVGTKNIDVTKPFEIGYFNITYQERTQEQSYPDSIIYNGVLFGSDGLNFKVDNTGSLEKITLSFDIKRANDYGKLVVVSNDEIIFEKTAALGHYNIDIPIGEETEYNVKIYSVSSEWRIWAPSYYDINKIIIKTEGFSYSSEKYTFELGEEYDEYKSSGMLFRFSEYDGGLIVKMNDKTIYSDVPQSSLVSISIPKNSLLKGQNTMVMSAEKNSYFEGSAKINVEYVSKEEKSISLNFNLTQNHYNNFGSGRIKFDVTDVIQGGGMKISIYNVNEAKTVFEEFDTVSKGSKTYAFIETQVAPGKNIVRIEGLEGSAFLIKNLKVSL